MPTSIEILWGIILFLGAILAGGVVTVASAMIPALRTFPPESDFRLHRIFNPLPDYYLPPLIFLCALFAIAVLALHDVSTVALALTITGIVLTIPIVAISLRGNRKFNLVVRAWTSSELPQHYQARRRSWDFWHIARTVLCVVAFACYAIAAGLGQRNNLTGTEWLGFASVFFAALMAGGLLIVLEAFVPTFRRAPDALSIRLHVAVDHYIEFLLPAVTVLTAAAAIAVLAVGNRPSTTVEALTAVGLGSSVLVALNSHLINRPMNQRIRAWPAETVPEEYAEVRRRWDRWHATRTTAGLVALVTLLVAFVLR